MNVIRTPLTSPRIQPSLGGFTVVPGLDGPERVPQPREPLTREQYEIAHAMSCTKVGCLWCGA